MKKLLLIFALTASAFAGTCGNGYSYAKKFTVPTYLVPNTDQTNFPVYLAFNGVGFGDILLSDLKTVANSGKIQNTAANGISITGPADLVFCDAASAGNALSYEVARYSATTGAMEAHVMIPTLSHTTATSFWMFYGNVAVVTTQQDLTLWSTAGFTQVCHLGDGTTLNVNCSLGGTQTNHGATAVTGATDGGANFVAASTQYIDTGLPYNVSSLTLEAWEVAAAAASNLIIASNNDGSGGNNGYIMASGAGGANLTPYFGVCNVGTCQIRNSNLVPSLGAWTHAVGTFSAGTANFYFDGVLSNGATSGSTTMPTSTANFTIGATGTHTLPYNGKLDEIRVTGSVRSADWIATTFNNQSSPSSFAWMQDVTLGTGPRVIQYATCRSSSPATCTFPNNVTSGNLLVAVISANSAGVTCTVPASNFSDTRSSTFTILTSGNSGGLNQAATCLGFAPLVSSGAEAVTLTFGSVVYGAVFEIAGVSSPSLDANSGATSGSSLASLSTGSATATTSNSIVVCGSAQTGAFSQAGFISSFSPSTSLAINNFNSSDGASALIQFTGSGSKSCTFGFNAPGTEQAVSLGIIKFTPSLSTRKRMQSQIY